MPLDRMLHPCIGDSEKVARLTDLEFRAWIIYLLVADDFGVMPMTPAKLRGGDRTLGNRSVRQIQKVLETLVSVDIVRQFDDAGSPYIWSPAWQYYQKIRYPRQTHYPCPPEQALAALNQKTTRDTRELFATFHGKVSETFQQQFGDVSTLTRVRARETAKGKGSWLTAEGNGERRQTNFDVWFRELLEAYPEGQRASGPLAEQAFLHVFEVDPREPALVFAELRAAVENQKQGAQWKAGKVPNMLRWLREGLFAQRHDTADPSQSPSRLPAWAQKKAQA